MSDRELSDIEEDEGCLFVEEKELTLANGVHKKVFAAPMSFSLNEASRKITRMFSNYTVQDIETRSETSGSTIETKLLVTLREKESPDEKRENYELRKRTIQSLRLRSEEQEKKQQEIEDEPAIQATPARTSKWWYIILFLLSTVVFAALFYALFSFEVTLQKRDTTIFSPPVVKLVVDSDGVPPITADHASPHPPPPSPVSFKPLSQK